MYEELADGLGMEAQYRLYELIETDLEDIGGKELASKTPLVLQVVHRITKYLELNMEINAKLLRASFTKELEDEIRAGLEKELQMRKG